MTDQLYEILSKPRRVRSEIRKAQAELEGLRLSLLPGAIRYDKDSVQSTPEDPMQIFIIKLEDAEKKLESLQQIYIDAQETVVRMANELDEMESLVIVLRYISLEQYEDISQEIFRSERQTKRYHTEAIEKLEELLKNVPQCH